jgi:hypothetical protein
MKTKEIEQFYGVTNYFPEHYPSLAHSRDRFHFFRRL